jgi:two-component system OmpR family response regulator
LRLLLVEDDSELAEGLRQRLADAGFAVDWADNGEDALFQGSTEAYDLAILDLGLPRLPGLEVLKGWRQKRLGLPVLILTARDTWREKVEGLKAGADDYLAKPFYPEELLARVQALIRRAYGHANPQIQAAGLTLDEEQQRVLRPDGSAVDLTGTEFRLLRYFMLNPGKPLSKIRLTEHVYDQDFDLDSNVIEVYVRRLREKIGHDRIETRRGQGYVFRA